MAIDDLDILREEMPALFLDCPMPPGWEDDWIFIPVEDPERGDAVLTEFAGDEILHAGEELTRAPIDHQQLPVFGPPGSFPGAPESRLKGEPPPPVPPPDALAFYLPFHYFHPTWWGVYLTLEGTHKLTDLLVGFSGGRLSRLDAFVAARLFLYGHEAFHHAVEAFATRLEVTHRRPLYRVPFQAFFDSTYGSDGCVEEALATAYGFLKVKEWAFRKPYRPDVRAIALAAIDRYIRACPLGYRRGIEFLKSAAYEQGRSEFAEKNHALAFPEVPAKDWRVWLSFPHAFTGVSRVTSRVNYICHVNAPIASRLGLHLRYLRYREVAERLESLAGCRPVREGKGSHVMWAPKRGKPFPVPRHPGDMRKGTLAAIIKQAGLQMSVSEFISRRG